MTIFLVIARVLLATPFLLSGIGILPEEKMDDDLLGAGTKPLTAPILGALARVLECVGGVGIAVGIFPRLSSFTLIVFLIPATLIGHAFWRSPDTEARMMQLMNFTKNVSMMGGLLFVLATNEQPALLYDARWIVLLHTLVL